MPRRVFAMKENIYDNYDEKFPITYWYGPPAEKTTVPVYRQVAEAGFTLGGSMGESGKTVGENLKMLDACFANGMKGLVIDGRMDKIIAGAEGWEQLAADMVEDYSAHPALFGYYVTDEPDTTKFEALGRVVEIFRRLDSKHPTYINLFPNYATAEQLKAPNYYTYVEEYIKICKPDFVSYDHYHFLSVPDPDARVEETSDERENLIRKSAMINVDRGGFFDNIEDVRNLCEKYNLPFMVIILLIQHGPYRYLTEGEIRFEAFQSLCYGAKYLSYFTYWTVIDSPDSWWKWREALVDENGCVLRHYYDVQKVNRDVARWGKILKKRKNLKVMHYGPEKERVVNYKPDEIVNSISGDCRLTIGEFEDGIVAIANKDFTGKAVFEIEKNNKKYSITLEAGDMIVIQ